MGDVHARADTRGYDSTMPDHVHLFPHVPEACIFEGREQLRLKIADSGLKGCSGIGLRQDVT
jgi:hypothetical protein